MHCAYCDAEKDASEFTPQSKRKCRVCIYAANRKRYHTQYRDGLAERRRAARRQRFDARKALEPSRSIAERAYTAGLIDGEGCVTLYCRGGRGGVGFRQGQFVCLVYVNSTTKSMIDWLSSRWGGTVCYVPEKPDMNRKAQWRWQLQSNAVLRMLDEIMEFMVVKRPQAKLIRRFQRYLQISGRKRTDKVDRVQTRFWVEVRRLNHRGVRPFIEPQLKIA
jgi:hypothetical protein